MSVHRLLAAAAVSAALAIAPALASQAAHPGPHPSPAAAAPATPAGVVTKLLAFDPEALTVPVGTTVVWKAGDGIAHTVTTGMFTLGGNGLRTAQNPDGRIDMPLSKDREVSYTFTEPGTYTYYCSIHLGMTGQVIVTP